jgi:4-amino-4-deoxy-L-arabinose transferase-like glycosyltransferase
MARKTKSLLLLLLLFAAVFSLRFIHLGADPPDSWTQTSLGYMSDPGGYAHNSRNKALFGDWEIDNWNRMYASIIPHIMNYLIFALFGQGIAQMNAVPALFSCLLLVVFFLILQRTYDRTFAVIGTALLGVNYIFAVFSQVAVRAVPMMFFVVLALYFLTRRRCPEKLDLALAGAMCFLAFMSKGTLLHVLPAVFLGAVVFVFFQYSGRIRPALSSCLLFLLGFFAVMGIWLLLFYLPHIADFQDFAASNLFWLTHGYEDLLQMFWMRPLFFFMDAPLLSGLSSLALLGLAYKAATSPKDLSLLSWVSGFWIVSNTVYFSMIQYRAARHLLPIILPIILLSVGLLHDIRRSGKLGRPQRQPILFLVFLFFWLSYVTSGLFILVSRPVGEAAWSHRSVHVLALAALGTGIAYLVMRFWPRGADLKLSPAARHAVIAFLVMFSVALNLRSWSRWAFSPPHDRQIISRDLGKAFHHIRLAGLVSMVMCLENTHAAHAYKTDYINKGLDFLDRYRITHALLSTHAEEINDYTNDFPERMRNARVLARYPIWHTHLVLYDLYPKAVPGRAGLDIFEGEAFFGENGLPRFDPDASGRLAFAAERQSEGSLLRLPLDEYPEGEYEFVFRLRVMGTENPEDRLARLDITSEGRRRAFTQADLSGRDFVAADGYRDFSLRLSLRSPRQLTLRLFATGKSELWFDSVSMRRLDK